MKTSGQCGFFKSIITYSVFVCVCVCARSCAYTYTCTCIYTHSYKRIFSQVLGWFLFSFVFSLFFLSLSLSLSIFLSLFISFSLYLSLSFFLFFSLSLSFFLSFFLFACLCIRNSSKTKCHWKNNDPPIKHGHERPLTYVSPSNKINPELFTEISNNLKVKTMIWLKYTKYNKMIKSKQQPPKLKRNTNRI